MITRIQGNNNKVNFGALRLNKGAQNFLTKADNFSSVHQRLALGTFGLIVQPAIDLRNKEVDKDTRRVSALRSAAKAIIGTATGIVVRGGCIKAAELKFAKRNSNGAILRHAKKAILDEDKIYNTFKKGFDSLNLDPKQLKEAINRVPSVIGTMAALAVMIATNFLVDAPLTNKTMEKLEEIEAKKQQKESEGAKNV